MGERISESQSPSRRSFSNTVSAIGVKISRTLSTDRTLTGLNDRNRSRESSQSVMLGSEKDRSVSRGRDVYQSSGRGGIGNIRNASASRDAGRPEDGPDDFSRSRGREPAPVSTQNNFSTGRGGAGNIRSPSRDVAKAPLTPDQKELLLAEEDRIIRAHEAADLDVPHSTGRGGAGNITSRSLSRGRAQTPLVHSTGRGGMGNIVAGEGLAAEVEDEEERKRLHHADGMHSTGRGGAANLTTIQEPGVERHSHEPHAGDFESTGRGGMGNLVQDRSRSRARNE